MSLWNTLCRWLGDKRSADGPRTKRQRVGERGENAAVAHLRGTGYTILQRNFRTRAGEIDVVAFQDGVLVFVEVRSRTRPAQFDPVYTITSTKRKRIRKAAEAFVTLHRVDGEDLLRRFDVITVLMDAEGQNPEVRHIEGAFEV
jgi:putative endonuclease